MRKRVRGKELSRRGLRASSRRDEVVTTRVTRASAARLEATFPGPSKSDRLRVLIEDATRHKADAEALCSRWTAAQERGDWEEAAWFGAVLAQEYRLRMTDLLEKMQALAQPLERASEQVR